MWGRWGGAIAPRLSRPPLGRRAPLGRRPGTRPRSWRACGGAGGGPEIRPGRVWGARVDLDGLWRVACRRRGGGRVMAWGPGGMAGGGCRRIRGGKGSPRGMFRSLQRLETLRGSWRGSGRELAGAWGGIGGPCPFSFPTTDQRVRPTATDTFLKQHSCCCSGSH